jgi:hypothetical protein
MGKKRFKEITADDKLKIRKEGKKFFLSVLGILLCTNIYHAIFYPNRTPNTELMSTSFGKATAIILVLLGILSAIISTIALKKVTKLVYQQYLKYFIIYFVFILLGFSIGISLWVALIILWLETKKSLVNGSAQ